jgi:CubicO group peptidase (beta-lactamase class C family)
MKKIITIISIIFFSTNSFSLDYSSMDISKAKKYKGDFHIPYKANPNLDTLKYYMFKYNSDTRSEKNSRTIEPSLDHYEFEFDLREYKFLNKELKKKGVVSYLYFENGKVIIDEMSPKDRLGDFIDNETRLRSNSMGKSFTSIILGHAICEGYIESVDTKINDWPLLKGSLYENHKLIDLLNMASGDQKYVYDSFILKNGKTNRNKAFEVDNMSVRFLGVEFKNKKASEKRIYNYNNVNTNLILNYVLFKSKGNFDKLLAKIFQKKAKIKYPVFFFKKNATDEYGNADPMFYATRFDYLRIAKVLMDDYQNNTCFGKYLKEIYNRKISKNLGDNNGPRGEPRFNRTFSYGGQFHLDWPGLKNKTVFAMGGRSGQAILIDMDDSRIIVLNSIHYNNGRFRFNEKKLLINPIKFGKKTFD